MGGTTEEEIVRIAAVRVREQLSLRMARACRAALASNDERKVGCVIVSPEGEDLGVGWNGIGIMHGVEDRPERRERPEKYLWMEHAERRAIYEAARFGHPLEGSTMFVTWYPCMDCARAIVECRIGGLVYGKEPDLSDPKWGEDFRRVQVLLQEAGVPSFWCEPCDP